MLKFNLLNCKWNHYVRGHMQISIGEIKIHPSQRVPTLVVSSGVQIPKSLLSAPQLEQKNNEQARNCALMIRGSNRTQHQRGSMA